MSWDSFVTIFYHGFFIIGAYFLGSLSSAILFSRLLGLPDPTTHGSNNPGATNVLRLGGKLPALLTLLGDALKGFIPVLLAIMVNSSAWFVGAVLLAVCLGHMFPIYFGFKGGKAVATSFGVSFAIAFKFGLVLICTWLIVAGITRLSSLAALVTFLIAPILAFFWYGQNFAIVFAVLAALILWRHHGNIKRLASGTEPKIGTA